MDYSAISEEIALEGLDGITLNALWTRLMDRPDFDSKHLDDDCKEYFWKYICSVLDLSFYILPEPRPELVIFKYGDCVSVEGCKCVLNADVPRDDYSHKMIDQDGIKGSCDHYDSRRNVTEKVRNSDGSCRMSLSDVTERWGQCFVIVASQRQRNLALLESAVYPPELSSETYCIMEAIGRARRDGEITQCRYARGLHNPTFSKFCQPANVFAKVKLLVKLGYVTKQPFTLKYTSPLAITQVRLIHLQRFYCATKANYRGCFQTLNDYLMSKPNQTAMYTDTMRDLNLRLNLFKKRSRIFKEHFSIDCVNYTQLYPDGRNGKTKSGVEKKIRIVRLIKPYGNEDDDDDDDDDDDEEDGDNFEDQQYSEKTKANQTDSEERKRTPICGYLSYHRSFMSQMVLHITRSGEKGLLLPELMGKLNVDKGMMKSCIKHMLRRKLVGSVKCAVGRNNPNIFVSLEVAERLKKMKVADVKCEPVAEMSTDAVVQEVSFSAEESSSHTSAGAQEAEDQVNYLELQINNFSVSCSLDRASSPLKPDPIKDENEKKLARKKFIIKQLALRKVFTGFRSVFKEICIEEKKQGLKERMCHKSLKRILRELYEEQQLCFVNVHEKSKPDKLIQQIIIEPGITLKDHKVKDAILQSSYFLMRLDGRGGAPNCGNQSVMKQHSPTGKPAEASLGESTAIEVLTIKPFGSVKAEPMVSVCQMLDRRGTSQPEEELKPVKSQQYAYGHTPKYERAKVLHKYLFYRHYGYEGRLDLSDTEADEGYMENPAVYLDVDDWRRHVPPLKKHNESFLASKEMDGVCMTGDVLLHMPLCLFCDVISVSWPVDGLTDLLKDPVKKNYPLTAVPQAVLKRLLNRRTYMFKFNDTLLTLCYLGLLTFGKKTLSRELEFISFYLRRKAIVFDTRKSKPGYLMTSCPEGETFERLQYRFTAIADLDNYWNDVAIICLTSKLGSYSVVDVKADHGSISLTEATQPMSVQESNDDNWLPGDHRGAGGFDSSLFIHRISSWIKKGNRGKHKSSVLLLSSESKKTEDILAGNVELIPNQKEEGPPAKKKKMSRPGPSMQPAARLLKKSLKVNKPRKAAKLDLKNYEDDVDRQAKLNMRKQRVYFTPLENGMLLLSQVANCILSPKTSSCVKSSVIRDVLQELLSESKDKTTRAVKGKMVRLVKEDKFRVHLVSYIAQAQSDKKLMENYKEKKYAIHSPEMENQFRQLHRDLRNKFSSTSHSEALPLPSCLGELWDQYEAKSTMDILYKVPKLTKEIHCVEDVKELVVWEFLESLFHLTKPLAGRDVYYTLSRFPEDVIHRAYVGLKTCGIFVQMKKSEKDIHQIINRSALLNNHKSTLRHRESLKTRYPADLFSNLKAQIDDLMKDRKVQSKDVVTSFVSGQDQSKSSLSRKNAQAQLVHTPGSELNLSSKHLTDNEPMKTEPATSQIEHGAKLKSHGSQDMSDLDEAGRAVGKDSLSEAGRTIGKDSLSEAGRAVAKDSLSEAGRAVAKDSLSEAECRELNVKQFQGGSVLAVISLLAMDLLCMKLVIPDEMVKLDEEGKRQLYFKRPRDEQQNKRKRDVLADSDEDSNDAWATPEKDASVIQHQRTGRKLSNRGLKNRNLFPSSGSKNCIGSLAASNSHSTLAESERCLRLKDVTLKMRCLKNSASGVLENFTVWVASGSLLTIARTSLIEGLDLLNSKCLLQRNFIVEPLDMKFALKQKTFFTPQHTGPTTKGSNSHTIELPASTIKGSNAHTTEPYQVRERAAETTSDRSIDSRPDKDPQNVTSPKDTSMFLFSEGCYVDLICHLEKCFSPDLDKDDMRPVLAQVLPSEVLVKGLHLLELIDSSGELGMTEVDLETKMSSTISQMKPVLWQLVRADAVFKVGLTQRRYVSRRHVKVWFLEVPGVSQVHQRSRINDDAHGEVDDDMKTRSCSMLYACRLWRHFDGTLNLEGLQTVLLRVMTYLMTHPGCSLSRLCYVFNPDLLPATTVDAVDILDEIGCVELSKIQKAPTSTLFSARRCLRVGDDLSQDESVTAVNVLIDGPMKLAFFLELTGQHCRSK